MTGSDTENCRRILVIDDNHMIHGDFHKIFATPDQALATLEEEAEMLFDNNDARKRHKRSVSFAVDSAYDGHEGVEKVRLAHEFDRPYALAIVDMRMPVGWDGVETINNIWKIDPDIQIVICTAYVDFFWRDILENIGAGDRMLVLKKPFEPVEAIQIAHMMTEKWSLQKQARQKMQNLEKLVSQRTEDLQRNNRDLKRKNEEIQYFYHTLSHELKTPLTSAKEFISIVSEGLVGELNETQVEYLNIASESCSHLAIYINDLFDAARLDTGKLSLNLEPVSLCNLIQKMIITMRPRAEEKNIRLVADLDTSLADTVVDESRIMQILTNLYNNALKFTPDGGSISIRLYQDPQRTDWVGISVADTGCGILEGQIKHLFHRYYQVEQTNPEKAKGVGLGLYLVNELVRLHDGDIQIESELGKGTKFTISLPMTIDVAAQHRPQLPTKAPGQTGSARQIAAN